MVDWRAAIEQYQDKHHAKFERELAFFRGKLTLEQAIVDAVASRDEDGKCYEHQRRIGKHVYPEATQLLKSTAGAISNAGTFERIIAIVRGAIGHIRGAGPLFTYDVSVRIGAKLGLQPEVVFLHAGTKRGARRFGFAGARDKVAPLTAFPRDLQALGASHLENFLCIIAKKQL